MARLIVFAETLGDGETLQRGQVIDICEDGQFAGKDVENGVLIDGKIRNLWRIVDMPGTPVSSLSYLLERDLKPEGSLDIVPLRKVKLDLDALESSHLTKTGKLDPKDKLSFLKAEIDVVATLDPVKDGGVMLPSVSV